VYESVWERSRNLSQGSSDGLLTGDKYQVTNFEFSPTYFAHRFQKPADYQVFVNRLFKLVTFHEVNKTGDLTIFWKAAKSVASETVKIHPSWNQRLVDIVKVFDTDTCVPYVANMERISNQ